jgi:hypothetical protein
MSNFIQLAWSVDITGSSFDPAQAAAALSAVVLYQDPVTDPVLGQLLGLTVHSDTTAPTGSGATRTLTLAMTAAAGVPLAPPPFPCHPVTPTPPVLPYKLQRNVSLAGGFTAATGSASVATEVSQAPSLNIGDTIQFASQLGVNYVVATVNPLTLTGPYTGTFANTTAFKVLPAPTTSFAFYSTSTLDSASGSGAQRIALSYLDSLGAPGTISVTLAGKRPVQGALAGGTIDIATIVSMSVSNVGGFKNSVGQITLSDLSAPISIDDTDDQAQLKLALALVYLPPSYFALTQQGASAPALTGDFTVSPDSKDVFTSVDQTGALSAGNTMQFASDPGVDYTVAAVTPKIVTLTTRYNGLVPTKTGVTSVSPSAAAPPTDEQLKTLLAEFVNPGNATPPPGAPLPPATMSPAPTLLSGFFARTISLALAVPVTSSPITLS